MRLVELPLTIPPFFLEACGYRGDCRYVALQWQEEAGELWLSDNGHAIAGNAQPMVLLWRRDGGLDALDSFRDARERLGREPWLLVDRSSRSLFLGDAAAVWRAINNQELAPA